MSKSLKRILLIAGIILVFGSVAAFLAVNEKTSQFWISYGFGVAALGAICFGGWKTSDNDAAQPSSYMFATLSAVYVVAVGIAIYTGYIKLNLPAGGYAAIHLILLAAYLVILIVAFSGHQYITKQGEEVRRQVLKARMDVERLVQMKESANDLPEEKRAEAKNYLYEVEEKLRYSDPMQSEETAEQAFAVEAALDDLEAALDELQMGRIELPDLQQKAKVAIRKIDAYNRAKKIMK